MRPKLELLDKPLIERILDEAFQLVEDPGVRVAPYVEDLLRAAGITVRPAPFPIDMDTEFEVTVVLFPLLFVV